MIEWEMLVFGTVCSLFGFGLAVVMLALNPRWNVRGVLLTMWSPFHPWPYGHLSHGKFRAVLPIGWDWVPDDE